MALARTRDDIDAVLDFWRGASRLATVSDNALSVASLLDHPTAWLLIADEDGRISGTLVAAWDGWRGSFYRLAVRDTARRRGIATTLVREGERRILSKGARRITAMVNGDDEIATSFWAAAGYVLDARTARYLKET